MRWMRPGVGPVSPAHFIPLAERSGLIVELGAWMIERAVVEAATWVAHASDGPRVGSVVGTCRGAPPAGTVGSTTGRVVEATS